jgi:uncharacterized integral membrane protein (TIGR00697 family)
MKAHSILPPPRQLEGRERDRALGLFLGLAGMFVASLVTCNLIFRKFFVWDLGGITFEQSVGLLPYPITFLVTDLISEIYGKNKANQVVAAGLVASVLTLGIIALAGHASATSWSPVNDGEFDHVFGQTALAVGASMAAYLLAQSLDVQLFHRWKRLTHGRHLWLRNNLSTIPSQIIDTLTVLVLLCAVGEIGWDRFGALLLNGVLFKACVAALDTPLVYLGVGVMRKQFGLKPAQEIAL